jgi:hypothetical protein
VGRRCRVGSGGTRGVQTQEHGAGAGDVSVRSDVRTLALP